MHFFRYAFTSSLVLSALYTQHANAQTDKDFTNALKLEEYTPAKALTRTPPKYPIIEAKKGKEGWVRLSYVISPEGKIVNPVIESSSGSKRFEKAALASVKQWQFTPAVENGKTIAQCDNNVQLTFQMNNNKAASPHFVRQYKKLNTLLEENKFDEVLAGINTLEDGKNFSMYEDAWLRLLKAAYYQKQNQPQQQYQALKNLFELDEFLPKSQYLAVLQQLFVYEAQNNLFSRALNTFKQLEKFDKDEKVANSLRPYTVKIQQAIDSEQPILVKAKLSNGGVWSHTLSRYNFSFAKVSNKALTLEVRCANKYTRFDLQAEKTWQIPQKWQNCNLLVQGAPNSELLLVEQPNNA